MPVVSLWGAGGTWQGGGSAGGHPCCSNEAFPLINILQQSQHWFWVSWLLCPLALM